MNLFFQGMGIFFVIYLILVVILVIYIGFESRKTERRRAQDRYIWKCVQDAVKVHEEQFHIKDPNTL